MNTVIQAVMLIFMILLAFGCITTRLRYRKLLSELECIRFEQQKLSFRLFVVEKKQKLVQETKAS